MAVNKYISKVKIGEINYLVKDIEARVLGDSAKQIAESALSKCEAIESEATNVQRITDEKIHSITGYDDEPISINYLLF